MSEPSTVLCVDDDPAVGKVLSALLTQAGLQALLAASGKDALALLERRPVDLVVSDLQMPRLDGVGLCRGVRSSEHPDTPVVIVTSVGDAQEMQRALDAGADGYVVKADFEQAHFLSLVETLIGPGAGS